MTYKIWRHFYFRPRYITSSDGAVVAVAHRSLRPLVVWFFGLLGAIGMTIDLASVFDASSGGLSFFLIPLALFGLPILAYQIDPKRPIVFFQETQKVVWFKAEPQSLWRLNQKGFDLVDHMGNRFGRINPRKGQVYDLDDRLMIETQVSMSDGKKLAAFIEIISLLSGGIRSTEGIGTDNKTYLSGKTPNKPIGGQARLMLLLS